MKFDLKKPLIIFFAGIVILSGFIVYVKKIHLPFLSKENNQKVEEIQTANIEAKDGKISLTYENLDLFFNSCCLSAVKEVQTEKDGENVKISGKAVFPFPSGFHGEMKFFEENGKVKSKITELTLGKIETPQMLIDKLDDLIQKGLDGNINGKYQVKDVKIEDEGIEIIIN